MTHLALTVHGLEEIAARLAALGGTVLEMTRTAVDLGGASLQILFLADPDGNRVELMETVATAQ